MRSVRLLFLSFLIAPMALADPRVFVSLAGSLLEAEITAVSGDNVTLKRASDQQPLVVNRKTLCKEDNAYIASWVAQHPDQATAPAPAPATVGTSAPAQKYRLVCQTLPAKSNRGPPDSDHRVFEYTYNFNLSNQEVSRDLQNARGLALTLGKSVLEPNGDLIVLQKEEFDVNIRPQSKMVHTTQPMRLTYSQDPDSPYGVKSYGYVLIIRDAAGNILLVEASPDASAKFTKEILALPDAPCMVDREFKLKSKTEVPLGYISF
ncbi:MAG: hypothetical protein K9N47_01005 [Prosthecobacter sp.]|uniref:hypothetical protein n=1 Tax=Prosthecobacter sp. TaxID=1965333 RepID=UPI0025D5B0F2|nr:hypothetical protein [Prosthecobacter sp.]MCF7784665.1 hypothetical protein [Prosthecobacter sp.]